MEELVLNDYISGWLHFGIFCLFPNSITLYLRGCELIDLNLQENQKVAIV